MKPVYCLIVAVCIILLSPLASANDWTGHVGGFLGAKLLDKDDWEPAENNLEFGVISDFGKADWPVNIAVDILHSTGDGSDPAFGDMEFSSMTTEICLGVRKYWVPQENASLFRPYVGGGAAMIFAEAKAESTDYFDGMPSMSITIKDDDSAIGFWVNGGVLFALSPAFDLGVDLRYSRATVTLLDEDGQAGGFHIGGRAGLQW